MYLSILKFGSNELSELFNTHCPSKSPKTLNNNRISQDVKRAAALAMTRDLLLSNKLLPKDLAKQTHIKHHESGEPFLYHPTEKHLPLHISISHSGPWMACVISPSDIHACIDLEDLNQQRNHHIIADHYFDDQEKTFVKNSGIMAFYKIWTAKEAIAKFHGKGLSEALKTKLDLAFLDLAVLDYTQDNIQLTQTLANDYFYTIAKRANFPVGRGM